MDIPSYLMGSIAGAKSASGLKYVIVDQLPGEGEDNIIYLVPKDPVQANNYYDEYMWINNMWNLIGDTQVDVSNKQDTMQYTELPTASDYELHKIYQYIGTTNANYTKGHFYLCVYDELGDTYSWQEIDVQDLSSKQDTLVSGTNIKTINGNSILGSGNIDTEIIQYSTIPTASASNIGKIIQYTGTTDSTYTNGYFYQCVSDGQDPATYSWENIQVQAGGGSASKVVMFRVETNNWYSSWTYNTEQNRQAMQTLIDDKNNINDYTIILDFYQTGAGYSRYFYCTGYDKNFNGLNIGFGFDLYGNLPSAYGNEYGVFVEIQLSMLNNNIEFKQKVRYLLPNNNIIFANNTASYTPTGNYNPATKKYVDDSIASAITTALQGNY